MKWRGWNKSSTRAKYNNITILFLITIRFVVDVLLACFTRRSKNRATVSYIIMLLKKITIFYSTVISYPMCGRVWSWSIITADSRRVGGGTWRGEGLFTVQNDRLCCGIALPPWSKIPMRSGERCVQPTTWLSARQGVVVNATGRRRDDAAEMKTFAGARLLHDDRRRRCTGTRVRNITSFACTRAIGTMRDENENPTKRNLLRRMLLYIIMIVTMILWVTRRCRDVLIFPRLPRDRAAPLGRRSVTNPSADKTGSFVKCVRSGQWMTPFNCSARTD